MRIINLDETGIKLITSTKKQMYLSVPEIKEFIDGGYQLLDHTLIFKDKKLVLPPNDFLEFPNILNYIKVNFTKKSST